MKQPFVWDPHCFTSLIWASNVSAYFVPKCSCTFEIKYLPCPLIVTFLLKTALCYVDLAIFKVLKVINMEVFSSSKGVLVNWKSFVNFYNQALCQHCCKNTWPQNWSLGWFLWQTGLYYYWKGQPKSSAVCICSPDCIACNDPFWLLCVPFVEICYNSISAKVSLYSDFFIALHYTTYFLLNCFKFIW